MATQNTFAQIPHSPLDTLWHDFTRIVADNPHSAVTIVLNLILALTMGGLLSLLYFRVLRENGKAQRAFVNALVLLPLVAAAATLIIGNNIARAFGLIGTVSVIRFRTMIKNAADMTFIFLAIILGMACGSSKFQFGFAVFLIFTAGVVILEKSKYGKRDKRDFIVLVKSDTPSEVSSFLKEQLKGIANSWKFQEVELGDSNHLTYHIVLEKNIAESTLVEKLTGLHNEHIHEIKIKRPE